MADIHEEVRVMKALRFVLVLIEVGLVPAFTHGALTFDSDTVVDTTSYYYMDACNAGNGAVDFVAELVAGHQYYWHWESGSFTVNEEQAWTSPHSGLRMARSSAGQIRLAARYSSSVYSRKRTAGVWAAAQAIAKVHNNSYSPGSIAINPVNGLTSVAMSSNTYYYVLCYETSADVWTLLTLNQGNPWYPQNNVGGPCSHAYDSAGNVFFAYNYNDPTDGQRCYVEKVSGSWASGTASSQWRHNVVAAPKNTEPRIAIDQNDKIHLFTPSGTDIAHLSSVDGGDTWSSPVTITSVSGIRINAAISPVDANRVAITCFDAGGNMSVGLSTDGGASWDLTALPNGGTTPTQVDGFHCALTFDAGGNLYVFYEQAGTDGDGDVHMLVSAAPAAPPRGTIVLLI